MALANKDVLGKWLDLYTITAFKHPGTNKFYAAQSTGDGGFVIRGRGIVMNADFVKDAGLAAEEILELQESDDYGVKTPQNWTTPEGYTKVVKNGADVYYPDGLIEQNPSLAGSGTLTTTGGRSADTFIDKTVKWINDNKLLAAIIAFVLYVFIIEPLFMGKKGKKSLKYKLGF